MILKLNIRPTPATSRIVRSQEAALYIGVSVKQLRRLVRLGHIPVLQQTNGSPWLFDLHQLDSYIASLTAAQVPMATGNNGFEERGHHA